MKPADYKLPFDDWRTGQLELIEKIISAPTKIVLLQAPPGVGKSLCAVGAARVGGYPRSVYLTATKQLQDQYVGLGGVNDVRGRNNFGCITEPVTADWGDCTIGLPCEYKRWRDGEGQLHGLDGCPYYDQVLAAGRAREVSTSYAYFMHTRERYWPDLLVCDEAHEMASQMQGFFDITLTRASLMQFQIPQPPDINAAWPQWQKWAREFTPRTPTDMDDKKAFKMLEHFDRVRKVCARSFEHVILSSPNGWRISPVWAGMFAASELLNHGTKTLLMSATILDPVLFCQRHGINPTTVTFYDVPSPFAPERRPLRYMPITKVGIGMTEDGISALVRGLDEILSSHPTEKGIVHTVSFKLASEVIRRTRHGGRILTHTGKDREKVFAQFRDTKEPRVLVSPSAMVGLDAPYDGCRFQVILKLPFPDKSDPIRVAQSQSSIGKELSIYDTAASLVQAYGRAMRAEDDWGVTYLTDESFGWFRRAARKFLPSWFMEAVRETNELGPLEGVR